MDDSKVKWNVLVFPGGNEIGLEIWRGLKDCKEVRLFSASSDIPNSAPFVYGNHFIIPDVRQSNWIDELNKIIAGNKIDYIFPANAFVIDALNENRNQVKCEIILASPEVLRVTRSKKKTLSLLESNVDIPKVFNSPQEVDEFPVFVKPDMGYGSRDVQKVETQQELTEICKRDESLVIQEFLTGQEYTIDCFSNRAGELLFCQGRCRARIDMGTSMDGYLSEEDFSNIARSILKKIPLKGAWFFQMKEDAQGRLKLLEVESRIAGTMALNRVRGANFALLSLFESAGLDVDVILNAGDVRIARALVNRFQHEIEYSKVYIDLDDTVIIHGKLNTHAVRFLYQCVNEGKEMILISKNLEDDKGGYLKKWKISEIFDEVIWLDEAESKADRIDPDGAIFIDDSFSARKEVAERHGIPTFDPNMLELLIDERM